MSQLKVAVVDDEPVLCRLLQRILQRRAGAEVTVFSDPRAALDHLRSAAVHVVLCDFRMPGMSGIALRQQLDRDVPFYMVTGELAAVERLRRVEGVLDVLEKPVPPERLIEVALRHAPDG